MKIRYLVLLIGEWHYNTTLLLMWKIVKEIAFVPFHTKSDNILEDMIFLFV